LFLNKSNVCLVIVYILKGLGDLKFSAIETDRTKIHEWYFNERTTKTVKALVEILVALNQKMKKRSKNNVLFI